MEHSKWKRLTTKWYSEGNILAFRVHAPIKAGDVFGTILASTWVRARRHTRQERYAVSSFAPVTKLVYWMTPHSGWRT